MSGVWKALAMGFADRDESKRALAAEEEWNALALAAVACAR